MAKAPTPLDRHLAGQARLVALVLIGTMVLWLGGRLGLEARFAFLLDFAAIAALVWALVVTWQIWRKRHDSR